MEGYGFFAFGNRKGLGIIKGSLDVLVGLCPIEIAMRLNTDHDEDFTF
jgi:hypothetical protein